MKNKNLKKIKNSLTNEPENDIITITIIIIDCKEDTMPEKIRRFSRKREAIRAALMEAKCHPSAEWIYTKLKAEMPDLSLATVYRNLNEMKQNGEIQSVAFFDGKERFDSDMSKHSHFICDCCGRIDDFNCVKHNEAIDRWAQSCFDGQIDFHTLVFHGVCRDCLSKPS